MDTGIVFMPDELPDAPEGMRKAGEAAADGKFFGLHWRKAFQ
jgi:hypothetical protein